MTKFSKKWTQLISNLQKVHIAIAIDSPDQPLKRLSRRERRREREKILLERQVRRQIKKERKRQKAERKKKLKTAGGPPRPLKKRQDGADAATWSPIVADVGFSSDPKVKV